MHISYLFTMFLYQLYNSTSATLMAESSELENQVKILREQLEADENNWQMLQLKIDKTTELLERVRAELRGEYLDGRGRLIDTLQDDIEQKENESRILRRVIKIIFINDVLFVYHIPMYIIRCTGS